MENKIKESLDEVIYDKIKEVSEMDISEEETKRALQNLKDLHGMRMDEAKMEESKFEQEKDIRLKQKQADFQTIHQFVSSGVQLGLGIATLVCYGRWFHKGLEFEKTGTLVTPWMKNLVSKMLPNKK